MPAAMASEDRPSGDPIERPAYDAAFPRVADAVTMYVWREPAFRIAGWAARAGIPAGAVSFAEALLCALVFWFWWTGRYWSGLVAAIAVMVLSLVGTMLARCTRSRRWENRFRIAVEIVPPLFWYWAWEHGLEIYGRPLEPVYATMVLWVIVGGAVAERVIETLAIQRFNGMEIHGYRPVDSRFRLVAADRNANLLILGASLVFARPDVGLKLVAWWTLISLIFHAVRLAQLTELQARRQKISSWLDP